MKKPWRVCLSVCLIALVLGWSSIGGAQQGKVPVEVWQWVQTTDVARVIVQLYAEAATTPTEASHSLQAAVSRLTGSLAGTKYRWIQTSQGVTTGSVVVPVVYMEVGKDALAVLDSSPVVKSVTLWSLGPRGHVPVDIWQRASGAGTDVEIIVQLRTSVPTTPDGALHLPTQRRVIAEAQDTLLARLDATGYRVTKRLTLLPVMGLFVQPDALVVVDRSPLVTGVLEDRPWPLLPLSKVPADVWQWTQTQTKTVPIIARLHTHPATTPAGVLHDATERQAIAETQDRLVASLAGSHYRVTARLVIVPLIGLEAGLEALARLDRSPLVEWVLADRQISPLFPLGKVPMSVWARAQKGEGVRLFMVLYTDPVTLFPPSAHAIAEAQDKLLGSLAGTQHTATERFVGGPWIALVVGVDALAVLDRSPLVAAVYDRDEPARPAR